MNTERDLRSLVRRGRHLDRWLDFKAHQMFEDVITYTALQFYTREPRDIVRIAAGAERRNGGHRLVRRRACGFLRKHSRKRRMADGDRPRAGIDRATFARLLAARRPVADDGNISGSDHKRRPHLSPRTARERPLQVHSERPRRAASYEVEIEDAIMKPLVSGPEAKRYEEPETNTYLLFPYERDARGSMRLILAGDIERRFPRAWAHLRRWERKLRKRETNSFDDETWYRFGRNQNSISRIFLS